MGNGASIEWASSIWQGEGLDECIVVSPIKKAKDVIGDEVPISGLDIASIPHSVADIFLTAYYFSF